MAIHARKVYFTRAVLIFLNKRSISLSGLDYLHTIYFKSRLVRLPIESNAEYFVFILAEIYLQDDDTVRPKNVPVVFYYFNLSVSILDFSVANIMKRVLSSNFIRLTLVIDKFFARC